MTSDAQRTDSYTLAHEILVQGLGEEPGNAAFIARHNRTIQFNIEGEAPFAAEIRDGKVTMRKGTLDDPDLAITATPEVLRKVFRGLLSPGEAWMDDEWWIGGAFSDYVGTSWMMRLIKAGVQSRMQQVWQ